MVALPDDLNVSVLNDAVATDQKTKCMQKENSMFICVDRVLMHFCLCYSQKSMHGRRYKVCSSKLLHILITSK